MTILDIIGLIFLGVVILVIDFMIIFILCNVAALIYEKQIKKLIENLKEIFKK